MNKDLLEILLKLPPDNPIFAIESKERSKKADEWLRLGANIEELNNIIAELKKLSASGNYSQYPETAPEATEKDAIKKKVFLVESILKMGRDIDD